MAQKKAPKARIQRARVKATNGGLPFAITAKDLAQAESMAAIGLPNNQIAAVLGIVPETFAKWEENPKFTAAVLRGKSMAVASVARKAYESALAGDKDMIKFWLKCQAGWSENPAPITVETNSGDSQVKVSIYLPDNGR